MKTLSDVDHVVKCARGIDREAYAQLLAGTAYNRRVGLVTKTVQRAKRLKSNNRPRLRAVSHIYEYDINHSKNGHGVRTVVSPLHQLFRPIAARGT